jgi:ubiquinone/menaquinone biosynthesis C-methylase UbiE
MDHNDHVALIRAGVAGAAGGAPPAVWADLGSGAGAFTLALADILGPASVIHSVDRDGRALREQERRMRARFPRATVHYHVADFTRPLDLPSLDGIVMANALHFVHDKVPVLRRLVGLLRPGGRFVLVEYNTDRGNHWVPYPFSYPVWEPVAAVSGFATTRLLATRPSRFLGEIYSALSLTPYRLPQRPRA